MAFTPFENVEINYKYIIYCEASQDTLCFANDVDDQVLSSSLLMNTQMIQDMKPVKIDVWSRPFRQRDYQDYLQQYAQLCTGKGCDYGNEEKMVRDGWTKHMIDVPVQ